MKKYFLTTALMGMFIAPAFGADKIITSANTCTFDVLGVSDNNATANTIATWDAIEYTLNPGEYLSVTETSVHKAPCPAGSYCVGGTEFTVDNANTSIAQCPTGYENSDAGAGADTQCYTACTVATANIAHATAVSGPDYYGAGIDACYPTACETGYDAVFAQYDYKLGSNDHGYIAANMSGDSNAEKYGLSASNTWVSDFDYGLVYGNASCQPTMDPAIGYIMMNSGALLSGQMGLDEFTAGLEPLAGSAKTQYMENLLIDFTAGRITEQDLYNGVWQEFFAEPGADYRTSDTGQYCYCQMDAVAFSGVNKTAVTSAPWVFRINYDSNESCASDCANTCASQGSGDIDMAFRFVAYAALEAVETGGMCKVTENNCPAGQYLAIVGDAMMCVPCKSGSYCPGGVYTIESENKGTNICPSGYPNSDAGASADTQCYTACSVDMVAHATAVTGNDYFGTGVDTCGATACETGYHVDGGGIELVEKDPLVPISLTDRGTGYIYVRADGTSDSGDNVDAIPADSITAPNTWAVAYSDGVVYGKASCQPSVDPSIEYIMHSSHSADMTIEAFKTGLEPLAGADKAEYITDVMSGNKSESEMYKALYGVFYMEPNANYATDSTGQYCYCQMDGFTPTGGTREIVTSAPWVFDSDIGSADFCAYWCAGNCAVRLHAADVDNLAFRGAVVGSLSVVETGKTCAANTINIDWNPNNNGEHIKNMCTYEGSITVPADPVKPGFTFAGWKLVENTTTE